MFYRWLAANSNSVSGELLSLSRAILQEKAHLLFLLKGPSHVAQHIQNPRLPLRDFETTQPNDTYNKKPYLSFKGMEETLCFAYINNVLRN